LWWDVLFLLELVVHGCAVVLAEGSGGAVEQVEEQLSRWRSSGGAVEEQMEQGSGGAVEQVEEQWSRWRSEEVEEQWSNDVLQCL
jgi:hypothetical protein